MKSRLFGKDPDAGKNGGQEEKGATEDEMVGWHHQLNGHELEQTQGDSEGQGSLVCCSPWDCKESHETWRPTTAVIYFSCAGSWLLGGLVPRCGAQASPRSGLSCCGARPRLLRCACGIFLDLGLVPSPALTGERNGNTLQYSCPENPMDRGAWRATARGVAKSRTRLSH